MDGPTESAGVVELFVGACQSVSEKPSREIERLVLRLRDQPLLYGSLPGVEAEPAASVQASAIIQDDAACAQLSLALARTRQFKQAPDAEGTLSVVLDAALSLVSASDDGEAVRERVFSSENTVSLVLLSIRDGRPWASVAELAKKLLVAVASKDPSFASSRAPALRDLGVALSSSSTSDSTKLRICDFVVGLSECSPGSLEDLRQLGLVEGLANLAVSTLEPLTSADGTPADPLVALNVLELLRQFLSSPLHLSLLVEGNVVSKAKTVVDSVAAGTADPMAGRFCTPALIEFFAAVAVLEDPVATPQDRVLSWMLPFLLSMYDACPGSDVQTLTNLNAAVCQIAGTEHGLDALCADGDVEHRLLLEYQRCVTLSSDARLGWLHITAGLLESWGRRLGDAAHGELDIAKVEARLRRFCADISETPGQPPKDLFSSFIWPMFRVPFREQRFAAFHLTQALCSLPFFARGVAQHPGFCEFISDRSTELHPRDLGGDGGGTRVLGKDGQEWKFAVVQQLLRTHDASSNGTIPEGLVELIKQYESNGPFYAVGESDGALVSTSTA